MSFELEDTIMRELGLPHHYSTFEGSRSCRGVRRAAAAKLPAALRAHGLGAHPPLMNAVMAVAEFGDIGDDTIRKTWQACANAIRAQVEGGDSPARMTLYVREHFARQIAGGRWMDKHGRQVSIRPRDLTPSERIEQVKARKLAKHRRLMA